MLKKRPAAASFAGGFSGDHDGGAGVLMDRRPAPAVLFYGLIHMGRGHVLLKKGELFRGQNRRSVCRFHKKRICASFFDLRKKRAGAFPKAQGPQVYGPAGGLPRVQICLSKAKEDMAEGAGDPGMGQLAGL